MTPRTIWQTYKTRNVPAPARSLIRSWREMNAGFEYRFCDDGEIDEFMAAHFDIELVELFRAMPLAVMRADIWRYAVLYVHGGVYTDLDTACLVPLDQWLPEGPSLTVGLEDDLHFCQWTLAAPPGHGALREVLALIRERAREGIDVTYPHYVHRHTGPGVWTEALCRYLGQPRQNAAAILRAGHWRERDVTLLDAKAFRGELVDHVFASVRWEAGYVSWPRKVHETSIPEDTVPIRDPHWTLRDRSRGLVLHNPWAGRHVACNPPAAIILGLCDGTRNVASITQHLSRRLNPVPAGLDRDVRETLLSLAGQGVLTWRRSHGASGTNFQNRWAEIAHLEDLQLYQLIKDSVTDPDGFVAEPSLMERLDGTVEGGRVLDFGCGLGRNMLGLVDRSDRWTVVGYDNPEMLARAAQWLPRMLASRRDALRRTRLCADWGEILDERFDLVIACLVFQHMRARDILKVLHELASISGRLVVVSRVNTDEQEDVFTLFQQSADWEPAKRHDNPPGSCHPGHWIAEFNKKDRQGTRNAAAGPALNR